MTPPDNISTPATEDLLARGFKFQLFQHAGPIRSLEQAAEDRGQQPGQVVRSLLFRLAEGDYVLVLVAGPAQVSWRALRSYLGRSRLTTASREEVRAVTGYELGAVTPFGLRQPLRVLIDHSVAEQQGEISIGSGKRGLAIMMQATDLVKALPGSEMGVYTG